MCTSKESSILDDCRWQRCGCPNRFRLAKENQSLIDKVRAEIPENAGGGIVRHLTPGAGLRIESKAVESGFVLGHRPQCAGFQKLS